MIVKVEPTQGTKMKILTPKQMLQRLPMTLVQVKAGKTSDNLLNGMLQIIYFLYPVKEITKKVYNNIMISMEIYYKLDTLYEFKN